MSRLAITLVFAFVCWGLWLASVVWITGWHGLAWFKIVGYGYGGGLLAIAVTFSILFNARTSVTWSRQALFVPPSAFLIAFNHNFFGMYVNLDLRANLPYRFMLHSFSDELFGDWSGGFIALYLGSALAVAAVTLVLYYLLLRLIGIERKARCIAYLFLGAALVLPFSAMTVSVFPALSGDRDFVHGIKMGYHVFWSILLAGFAMRLGRGRGVSNGPASALP